MQEIELKNLKINLINSVSTVVIAFVSFVGLILALTEFIEVRNKFFGFEKITFIMTVMILLLSIIIYKLKIWTENE